MRPRRLRIHGFTCYREVQEIDFAPLDLFAIAGPTGAGKTSILDAMVFALYGEVPRMGAQRLGELISLGLDRASSMLEFEIGGTTYRVTRTMRRRGAAQAQLERVEGAGVVIAGTVREVEGAVERLLGIDASTFLKAVVLPQGKFAEFLHSRPAERRAIVRALLQLDIYERMRERAGQLGRQAASDAEALRQRLDDDYRDATPERIAEIDAALERLARELDSASASAGNSRTRRIELEHAAAVQARLRDARAQLAAFDQRAHAIGDMQRAVERAEAARPLLALLEARDTAHAVYEKRRQELAELEERVEAASQRHDQLVIALKAARAAANEIDELHGQLGRLSELEPVLARRSEIQRRLEEAVQVVQRADEELDEANDRRRSAERNLNASSEELASVRARLAASTHDSERLRRLELAMAPAAHRQAQSRLLAQISTKRVASLEAITSAEAKLAHARREAENTACAEAAASERELVARERLQLVEQQHKAHVLRAALSPGESCPVCLNVVTTVPRLASVFDLDQAREHASRAQEELRGFAERARSARRAHEAAQDAVDRARLELADIEQQIETAQTELDELERTLVTLLGEDACRDVSRLHADARKQADLHARLLTAEQEALRADAEARHAIEMAETAARRAVSDRDRARAEHASFCDELAIVDARIRAVAPSGDPVAERRRLSARIEDLVARRDEALRAEEQTRRELEEFQRQRAIAEAAASTSGGQLAEARERVERGLAESSFAHEAEARAAALPKQECDRLAREIETWKTGRALVASRVEDLEREAGPKEVTSEQLEEARRMEQAAEDQHRTLLQQQAALRRDREQLSSLIAKADELRERLGRFTEAYVTYDQLAADLRTDRFQACLLDDTFHELVAGASIRLRDLSAGRYTLEYAGDDFFVVDHDNARERRRAETLSGGETFLAALALALQLSEQIQRAAGAVRLDSLFIDEGFGTLDADTLGTVADAIQQIGRGNRMVGIITHVPELTAALPARLEIKRTPAGSRIETVIEA